MSDEANDQALKKCPRCGSPLKPGKPCAKCAAEGIEVQFKDFKISELLDIKMPVHRKKDEEDGKE